MPHPEPEKVLGTLRELQGKTAFDLHAKLLGEGQRYENFLDYVRSLGDLRNALFDFFSFTQEPNPLASPEMKGP
jgi:hypothetical protein